MYRLVIFDMDKTVIPITATEYLGKKLGVSKIIDKWEKEYHDGTLDSYAFAERLSNILKGKSLSFIHSLLTDLPLLEDIKETIASIHEHNIHTALVTVGPGFIAKYLAEKFGFEKALGTKHKIKRGIFCGKVGKVLTDKDKLHTLQSLAKAYKIPLSLCAAVGDGISDIPLFEACGFSIALNAKDESTKNKANIAINTNSMLEIIPYIMKRTHVE